MTLLELPIEVIYQDENDWEDSDDTRQKPILIDPQKIEALYWAGENETRVIMGNEAYYVLLPFDVLRSKLASMGWRIETIDQKENV